jgi:hypothetical protein
MLRTAQPRTFALVGAAFAAARPDVPKQGWLGRDALRVAERASNLVEVAYYDQFAVHRFIVPVRKRRPQAYAKGRKSRSRQTLRGAVSNWDSAEASRTMLDVSVRLRRTLGKASESERSAFA